MPATCTVWHMSTTCASALSEDTAVESLISHFKHSPAVCKLHSTQSPVTDLTLGVVISRRITIYCTTDSDHMTGKKKDTHTLLFRRIKC